MLYPFIGVLSKRGILGSFTVAFVKGQVEEKTSPCAICILSLQVYNSPSNLTDSLLVCIL